MIRLDTIELSVQYPALKSFDQSKFKSKLETDLATGEFEEIFILKKQQLFGFDHMAIKENKAEIILKFSAKALKSEYYELINKNNIQKVFETINLSGIANFNVAGAIENSNILKCDVTNNLRVSEEVAN